MRLGQGLCFFCSKFLLCLDCGLWTQWPVLVSVPSIRAQHQIFPDQNFGFLCEVTSKFKYWGQIQTYRLDHLHPVPLRDPSSHSNSAQGILGQPPRVSGVAVSLPSC